MNVLPILLIGIIAVGRPAFQEADDWDYGEDPARNLSIAAVTFENFGVAVRCLDGHLGVVFSGLPAASGLRTIRHRIDDGEEYAASWISGPDSSSAFAIWPRHVATGLSRGGRLSVVVPDGEETVRYSVELPASGTSVRRVFNACGHDLEAADAPAAPDGENLAGLVWRRVPYPDVPSRTNSEAGLAGLTCEVRDDGRLQDCQIESEFPAGSGFGRAARSAAHRRGQVSLADGATTGIAGRRISFMARYRTP